MAAVTLVLLKHALVHIPFTLTIWIPYAYASGCYTSFFSFGDSLSDTGNALYLSNPPTHCGFPPNGETYFHHPTGRCYNGRLIIDFIAQHLGLPFLPPYFGVKNGSEASDFRQGVNFAVVGVTALGKEFFDEEGIANIFTNISMDIQLSLLQRHAAITLSSHLQHTSFQNMDQQAWEQKVMGNPMFCLSSTQKKLKLELKELNKSYFNDISRRIEDAKMKLADVQRTLHQTSTNVDLRKQENELTLNYVDISSAEESFYSFALAKVASIMNGEEWVWPFPRSERMKDLIELTHHHFKPNAAIEDFVEWRLHPYHKFTSNSIWHHIKDNLPKSDKLPHFGLPPYGETYFHCPTGRCSDGRVIIDFIAQYLGLPFVPPYFGGKNGSEAVDFRKGVNFAVAGATALDNAFFEQLGIHNPYTNTSLETQLSWFKDMLPSLCVASLRFTRGALTACCGAGGPYNYNSSVECGYPPSMACDDPSLYANWDGLHLTEAPKVCWKDHTPFLPRINTSCVVVAVNAEYYNYD
ncbi:hypothetical protein F0562_013870 [Nyssa sinensis]|uniref:GDSL esterase/lipase n=1 Tax=Nyssa sinensis TaxID=561372 RepID=A0A5J4ZM35_9ASTE|nr:hypothetical protein F0562_013870 [Nyssa sinensis]